MTAGNEEQIAELEAMLQVRLEEHRDLDASILALENSNGFDQLRVQRLKKRKLMLKDQISRLESLLTPDIIA